MTKPDTTELAHLARLARDGGLDLSQVSLRVKADLLLSAQQPPIDDLRPLRRWRRRSCRPSTRRPR